MDIVFVKIYRRISSKHPDWTGAQVERATWYTINKRKKQSLPPLIRLDLRKFLTWAKNGCIEFVVYKD